MCESNIALNIFGVFLAIILIICSFFDKTERAASKRWLQAMLISNLIVLICIIVNDILNGKAEYTAINYVVTTMSFIMGYTIALSFNFYLMEYLKPKRKKLISVISILMYVTASLLIISSCFSDLYFTITDGVYKRGKLYWLSHSFIFIIPLINIINSIIKHKFTDKTYVCVCISYCAITIIALIIQVSIPHLSIIYVATLLAQVIVYMLVYVRMGYENERHKTEFAQQQIALALSQMQPHFIFNSLDTIRYFCDKNSAIASDMVYIFAKYMRFNMDALVQNNPIPFSDDLHHAQRYVAIEKRRFKGINLFYNIEVCDFSLPPLTIQPIVENAIKNGSSSQDSGTEISISSSTADDNFIVTISSNSIDFQAPAPYSTTANYCDIENIRNRLQTMCGGALDIENTPDGNTSVIIKIPNVKLSSNM